MKHLALVLSFGVAANYFPVGKEAANKVYTKKTECEQLEQMDCYDISGKDLSRLSVGDVTEDDLSKPIYKPAYNLTTCDEPMDCSIKIGNVEDPSTYCNVGDIIRMRENTLVPGWSFYCTKLEGYEQKTVTKIIEAPEPAPVSEE